MQPIMNPANAIIKVIAKLIEGELIDNSKKSENKNITIIGWKKYLFKIVILFRKLKKFSLGYKLIKKLLTHLSSINLKILKIKVNKNDS